MTKNNFNYNSIGAVSSCRRYSGPGERLAILAYWINAKLEILDKKYDDKEIGEIKDLLKQLTKKLATDLKGE